MDAGKCPRCKGEKWIEKIGGWVCESCRYFVSHRDRYGVSMLRPVLKALPDPKERIGLDANGLPIRKINQLCGIDKWAHREDKKDFKVIDGEGDGS